MGSWYGDGLRSEEDGLFDICSDWREELAKEEVEGQNESLREEKHV